ncbi:MAG: 3-oxoacyl-ACP synthase III [Deltaproteobacteria bacterium]|nr:MAG: 3-oxoacyl-ACP synthase III [Deltaproteobacteria bacterium]
MRYEHVAIAAVASALPEREVTTEAIERMLVRSYERLGLRTGFIEGLTGVRARRIWPEGVAPSDAATQAAERLLEATGYPRDRLGALVSTSVCKDFLEPAVASLVHGNLGLPPTCLNFDVGNACLGFMSGMVVVADMIELGQIEAGLVVAGEGSRDVTRATVQALMRPGVDFARLKDNLATLTLGSGAAAMLLVRADDHGPAHRLRGGVFSAATEWNRLCIGTATQMTTDPARLLQEGVKLATGTWARLQDELSLSSDDVSEFVLHQVGKANHDAVTAALGIPPDRALRTYPDLGNCGAAGVPLSLDRAVATGRVLEGDTVALMGIGSGLNCAMMVVDW